MAKNVNKLRLEAEKKERIAFFKREQAMIERMIAAEEKRRQEISNRLKEEIRRLEQLKKR